MDIVKVYCDDWKGIYIDGKLLDQHHTVRLSEIFKEIHKKYPDITFDIRECNDQWCQDRGNLPDNLNEVKYDNN